MLNTMIQSIAQRVSAERVFAEMTRLHELERRFTFPGFLKSAAWVARKLERLGAEGVEVVKFPADGRALYGAWRAPLAWDAKRARLTIVKPGRMAGRVLADYEKVPCGLVMWSGPTPPGGIVTEVLNAGHGASEKDYAGRDFKGKIALVDRRASAAKGMAARAGAVGILSDWLPSALPDAVFWNNAFNDNPAAWGASADCSRLFGFGVSPETGKTLRAILDGGAKLIVQAEVQTRLYRGHIPVVTGLIPGRGQEEVLALGHGFEQGACDNSAGVACMLEAMRVLSRLIADQTLPKPRRSIRMLMTNECLGTLGYAERFSERMRRTLCALCVDSPGIDTGLPGSRVVIHRNPHACADVSDTFAEALAGKVFRSKCATGGWQMAGYSMTDNLITHPSIGVPTVFFGKGGREAVWHTTADTPGRLDAGQLGEAAVYAACYLYFLAGAGADEAAWLAELSAAAGRLARCARFPERGGAGKERLAYEAEIVARRIESANRLAPRNPGLRKSIGRIRSAFLDDMNRQDRGRVPGAARLKKARVSRKNGDIVLDFAVTGPLTLDPLTAAERAGRPDERWGGPGMLATEWINGKRTLREIVRLVERQTGVPQPALEEKLLFLISKGLLKGNGPNPPSIS